MKQIQRLLIAIAIGGIGGLVATVLVLLAALVLLGIEPGSRVIGNAMRVLFPFGSICGAVIGGMHSVLRNALDSRELITLCTLISIAIGSAVIMNGGFADRSRMPFAIYGLAIINGLSVLPLVEMTLSLIGRKESRFNV